MVEELLHSTQNHTRSSECIIHHMGENNLSQHKRFDVKYNKIAFFSPMRLRGKVTGLIFGKTPRSNLALARRVDSAAPCLSSNFPCRELRLTRLHTSALQ